MSGCADSKKSTSQVPEACDVTKRQEDNTDESRECTSDPVTFAVDGLSSSDLPYETAMGLAKDGHLIVGPYNEDGELWSCDDHDICNGVFLSDNSYAYAMTYTFPYVVGCWGPGPQQVFAAGCSSRSCSDGAVDNLHSLAISTLALSALVLAQL